MMSNDIITGSGEIRKLLLNRSEELGIDLHHLWRESGYGKKKYNMRRFLEGANNCNQDRLIKIASMLGIEIRIKITIKEDGDYDKLKQYLNKKYYEPQKQPKQPKEAGVVRRPKRVD